ncbi:MAG: hypothetical protein D6794_02970 [Deltaproteobacteria bacterium]|nr:MAG: hypothetical protein D6794_02970 [Deltaproteobacteria bacterium]
MRPAALLGALWRLNRWAPVLLVLLLLANAGLWLYSSQKLEPELEQRERQFLALQKRMRQARKMESSGPSPREAFTRGQQDLQRFLERVPDQKRLSALIKELFDTARQAGLEIRAISYQPKPLPELGLVEYGLSFAVGGDYRQVKTFINLIEKSERIIVVNQVRLERGSKDEGRVRLSLQLTTYFRRGAA